MKRNHEPTRKKRNFKKCLCNHIDEVLEYRRKLTNRPFFLSFMDLCGTIKADHSAKKQLQDEWFRLGRDSMARPLSWKAHKSMELSLSKSIACSLKQVTFRDPPKVYCCLLFVIAWATRNCAHFQSRHDVDCGVEMSCPSFHFITANPISVVVCTSYQGSSSIPNRSHYQEHQ